MKNIPVGSDVNLYIDSFGFPSIKDKFARVTAKVLASLISVPGFSDRYFLTWNMCRGSLFSKNDHEAFVSGLHGINILNGVEQYYGQPAEWTLAEYIITAPTPQITIESKKVRLPGEPYLDGNCCSKCGTFAVYAAKGFTCFSCKQDPYRLAAITPDDWET